MSNLPTVWTNALVGAAAAGWASVDTLGTDRWSFFGAWLVVSFLYAGGMFLNDAIDAEWDRVHGRSRPIPTGRLSRRAAFAWSLACLLLAVAVAGATAGADIPVAVIGTSLVTVILLYDLLHKKSPWCVLLMGACRALVYPLAAAVVLADGSGSVGTALLAAWPASIAILAYTALLTLAARREDVAGAKVGGVWAWLVPAPYMVAASAYRPDRLLWTMFVAAGFFGWVTRSARLARDGRIPDAVSGWLAGICLADATLLMLMNRLDLAGVAVAGWLLTVVMQRAISGT